MTAQETGQRLRECRTRHHRITSGFLGLELEIALNVGNESHDRGALLEELGQQQPPVRAAGCRGWRSRAGGRRDAHQVARVGAGRV